MIKARKRISTEEKTINPFETVDNTEELMKNLASIDRHDIRCKFKNTQDPINLAFDTINQSSLKTLAKDFVKESFYDLVSFVSDICK